MGAGRGASTIAMLTLGTGIGGGLVIDGKLHLGATGTAGEIGHQTVHDGGRRCGCGNLGCAEPYAQAGAMMATGRPGLGRGGVRGGGGGRPGLPGGPRRCVHRARDRDRQHRHRHRPGPRRDRRRDQRGRRPGDDPAARRRRDDGSRSSRRVALDLRLAELGPGAGAIGAALAGLEAALTSPTAWSTGSPAAAAAADLRATKSSSISAVRVAPQRSAPASMTSINASRVRTPPAALTLTRGDTRRAHQSQVLERRAARREPGRCLDVVGAGSLGRLAAADDLVLRQVGVLEDDLDDRPSGHGVDDRPDVRLDLVVHPGSQPADVDDHVELGRAVRQRTDRTRTPSSASCAIRAGSR